MKSSKTKDLAERLMNFAVLIIKLVNSLPNSIVGRHIKGQLIRSGTSAGANYEEACGAGSRADFSYKLGIVLKELKETRFWLRVIDKSGILHSGDLHCLIKECEELCAIIAKSIVTVKSKGKQKAKKI